MPDLLQNNLLEGSALSLVKSMTDIEQIWRRLKGAYDDPKLLLKKNYHRLGYQSTMENKGPRKTGGWFK